ncbi:MAG: PhzF family phenazine biosynthesis protein [bacterium]
MKIPIYQIDAFTNKLFGGNPAAVCPLEEWLSDERMQAIAAENNLSETAFFVKNNNNRYDLRWFTPKIEIDLAGHPTLATAYVIFEYIDKDLKAIEFETKSGILKVEREGELLSMDFPSRPASPSPAPDDLIRGLGKQPDEVFLSRDYLVVYDSEEKVRSLSPDMNDLLKVESLGVIVTAPGKEVDFVSRFFAPRAGIPEDPVTGSAHSTLIPYWAHRLDKKKLHAHQVSARGGELFCEDRGDRVKIAGAAVTYLEGAIYL